MPLDRGAIEQQLIALGEPASWWDRRELRDLPDALTSEERILAIAFGRVLRRPLPSRSWLIVITNQRMLCIKAGDRMGRRQFDLHAQQITAVTLRGGILHARVIVASYGEKYRFSVRRTDAVKLMAALTALAQPRESVVRPGPVASRIAAPTPPDRDGLERRLQLLEDEVQRLQQQVDFLEDLLRTRLGLASLPAPGHTVSVP